MTKVFKNKTCNNKMSNITDILQFIHPNPVITGENSKYYGSTYACKQTSPLNSDIISGFKCYKFNDFVEASEFIKKNENMESNKSRTLIVPVSKFLPMRFHKFAINSYLNHYYWKNNITIMVKKDEINK